MKKLKGCFRLPEYSFRKKIRLEGDGGFYDHLRRELMRNLLLVCGKKTVDCEL